MVRRLGLRRAVHDARAMVTATGWRPMAPSPALAADATVSRAITAQFGGIVERGRIAGAAAAAQQTPSGQTAASSLARHV